MGKYADQLHSLRERRNFMERQHNRIMNQYSEYMDDVYRRYNEQTHSFSMRDLDRRIEQAQWLADQERAKEISVEVMKNITKDSGQTAKAVATEIQKALKGLKL